YFFLLLVLSPPAIYPLSLHDALPILGAVDGATAWFTPAVRSMMAGIMVGSSIKGMLVGLFSGWFARKVQSTVWGIILGSALGLRSEEHTSELQSRGHLVCRLLLEKKK